MADSIYDQALLIARDQITTLVAAIDPKMLQEKLEPREFDWDDVGNYVGVSLRYTEEDVPVPASQMSGTNSTHANGYPIYLVMVSPKTKQRTPTTKNFRLLKDDVRRYYHHRRRMEDVCVDGVLPTVTTVRTNGPNPPRDLILNNKVQILTIMCWFFEPQTA